MSREGTQDPEVGFVVQLPEDPVHRIDECADLFKEEGAEERRRRTGREGAAHLGDDDSPPPRAKPEANLVLVLL